MATSKILFDTALKYNWARGPYTAATNRTITWADTITNNTCYLLLVKNYLSETTFSFDLYIVGVSSAGWTIAQVYKQNPIVADLTSITNNGATVTLTFSGMSYSSIGMFRIF